MTGVSLKKKRGGRRQAQREERHVKVKTDGSHAAANQEMPASTT